MEVSLLRIDLQKSAASWRSAVRQASGQTSKRMYAWFQGPPAKTCNMDTLQTLADLYEAVADVSATLDVVPMFECAGWSDDAVAGLQELTSAVMSSEEDGAAWIEEFNERRCSVGLPAVTLSKVPALKESSPPPRQHEESSCRAAIELQGQVASSLKFSDVAVGGTFDNLHAGHRLLLAAAALMTAQTLWLGMTSDALLTSKSNKQLLEPYEERDRTVQAFIQRVHPGLRVSSGPLTDPKALPLAGTMAEMEALVVSRETTAGAQWINSHRESVGYETLAVVVVGLIGAKDQKPETKLSSSTLREAKALKATAKNQESTVE